MSVTHVKSYIKSMPAAEREAALELAAHIKHCCGQAGAKVAYPAVCLVFAELEAIMNAVQSAKDKEHQQ